MPFTAICPGIVTVVAALPAGGIYGLKLAPFQCATVSFSATRCLCITCLTSTHAVPFLVPFLPRFLSGTTRARLRELYSVHGDLGDVAAACRRNQTTLRQPAPLTVAKVFATLRRASPSCFTALTQPYCNVCVVTLAIARSQCMLHSHADDECWHAFHAGICTFAKKISRRSSQRLRPTSDPHDLFHLTTKPSVNLSCNKHPIETTAGRWPPTAALDPPGAASRWSWACCGPAVTWKPSTWCARWCRTCGWAPTGAACCRRWPRLPSCTGAAHSSSGFTTNLCISVYLQQPAILAASHTRGAAHHVLPLQGKSQQKKLPCQTNNKEDTMM